MKNATEVRTRFAPSPTGSLHIGGVRTAIFNWAYARKYGGKFFLRIDDTDQDRHVEGAIEQIIDGLFWVGLDWDNAEINADECYTGIVYQSLRKETYRRVVEALEFLGYTYRCYCTADQISTLRDQCRKEGRRFCCSCRDNQQNDSKEFCVRFNTAEAYGAEEGPIVVNDLILDEVSRDVSDISDPVIVRADGSIVYALACVIDDHDMNITHVIRGQEHLSNTFLQLLIFKALGWTPPQYAHIPFICAPPPSTKKLSKRDALTLGIPITVQQYEQEGYLPEALFNYLSHLGWAMDAETEKWTQEEFVKKFDFSGTVRKSAHFDLAKCLWLNGEYLKEIPVKERYALILKFLPYEVWPFSGASGQGRTTKELDELHRIFEVVKAAGDRLRKMSDILNYSHFWDDDFYKLDESAVQKRLLKDGIWKYLQDLRPHLTEWDKTVLEDAVHKFADANQIKVASLIHALRVATTGTMIGFGVFEGMEILGAGRGLKRIDDVLSKCALQQQ